MQRERLVTLSAGLWLSLICAGSAGAKAPDYGKLPLGFEANAGQTDGQVKFLARGPGYSVFLTGNAAVLSLQNTANTGRTIPDRVIRMKLVGANVNAGVLGADQLPGKTNYFIGNDPSKWRTHVPNYAEVKYADVFPGVDLVYHGNLSGQLEFDFVVAPGADPSAIRFTVAEDRSGLARERRAPVRIGADGDLVVKIGGGEIRFNKPVVYQLTANSPRVMTQGRFVLTASHQVRFALGTYDHSKTLIIDPSLVYLTYLGGSSIDQGFGIAVDSAGSAYVAGFAGSTDFPTVNPPARLWSTRPTWAATRRTRQTAAGRRRGVSLWTVTFGR